MYWNNAIVIFGGFNGSYLDTVQLFNGTVFKSGYSTIDAHSNTSAANIGSIAYVFGGLIFAGTDVGSIESFNGYVTAYNSASLYTDSSGHASSSLANNVYIFGGTQPSRIQRFTGTSISNDTFAGTINVSASCTTSTLQSNIYAFDGNADTFYKYDSTTLTNMGSAGLSTEPGSATTLGVNVFLFGSTNSHNKIHRYDGSTFSLDSSTLTTGNQGQQDAAVTNLSAYIFTAGAIQKYDGTTLSTVAGSCTSNGTHGTCSVNGKYYY